MAPASSGVGGLHRRRGFLGWRSQHLQLRQRGLATVAAHSSSGGGGGCPEERRLGAAARGLGAAAVTGGARLG
jgi:hypothetical protein